MRSLNFKLEIFEGPLDLLLSLIEKNKIDICDIEISLLLDQYMEYLEQARMMELDLAADFLEMASTLVYIKSRTLLPKEENEDEEDPKLVLERRLAEYAKCKKAAAFLAENSLWGKVFFRESEPDDLPKIAKEYRYSPLKIMEAYAAVIKRLNGKRPLSPSNFSKIIGTKFISVGTKIISLLRILIKKTTVPFKKLFKGMDSRSEIVATFLAVLELIRSGRVDVTDSDDPDITLIRNKK
ncbi:MAG: segregation/condensation protein A [Clostridia bacterium]|nr:segregation/condensation protein A [Clostridia bacterium]